MPQHIYNTRFNNKLIPRYTRLDITHILSKLDGKAVKKYLAVKGCYSIYEFFNNDFRDFLPYSVDYCFILNYLLRVFC